jgi:hypothetical protein
MWKEAFIAYFQIISRELPRRPKEKHENANIFYAMSKSVVMQFVSLHREAERFTA